MHRESISIIVQQYATVYGFIIFLQTALHVSDDTLIHHQEHTQTVLQHLALVEPYLLPSVDVESEQVPTPPRQQTVANKVRPVPDVVITV